MPMVEREPEDRIEGSVIVAFYRKRTKERLVPMTKTNREIMAKLYEGTCIVEVPFKIKETLTNK
ncbi:MAG: hypothetical protein QXP20_03705 [Candidatus Bathyarchaeia archaeon]